jgi:hypothetical protein
MPNKPKLNYTPSSRDLFQTPNYATKLLIPYIPKNINTIWECACGKLKITDVLCKKYNTCSTDLPMHDFLRDPFPFDQRLDKTSLAIVTNPPYSLKKQFYERCREFQVPFALLIPFDMCGWLWNAFKHDGCQGIIPNRRINYITPTGKSGDESSAQFLSFWLTWGFDFRWQMEWVELTKEMMQDI